MVSILTTPLVENPLRFGLRMRRTPNPCILVLFGVTGDLAHRKLLPAIYNLYVERRLPANFSIVGFARRALSELDGYDRRFPAGRLQLEAEVLRIDALAFGINDLSSTQSWIQVFTEPHLHLRWRSA